VSLTLVLLPAGLWRTVAGAALILSALALGIVGTNRER
jgi:hypothetical protein